MRRSAVPMMAWVVCVGVMTFACSKKDEKAEKAPQPEKEYLVLGEFVNPEDTLPRVRYFEDSQVTLNDRCAVRKVKLNTKMPAVYVNGQPVGFC